MNSQPEGRQTHSGFHTNLELLLQVPHFSGLPLEALKVLAYLGKREVDQAGDLVFHQNEVDSNAYFIIGGKARAVLNGEEEAIIAEYGEGDCIGTLSILSEMKRLFTLKAESDLTCFVLSREKFQKTVDQFPGIRAKLFEALVKNIFHWEARFLDSHGLKCPGCMGRLGISLL